MQKRLATAPLPEPFAGWFAARGWTPRPHQLDLIDRAREGRSVLLIAPTGAGKTLAGFLPSLIDLVEEARGRNTGAREGPHTLYISPLKALAVDIARNLAQPVEEMGLPVSIETRTGDTPQNRRKRQKETPPDILLTTVEQVALLVSQPDAARYFSQLRAVVVDELHSVVTSKRGDLLALGLARLRSHAPGLRTVGLSATVADPDDLRAWLVPQAPPPAPRALADRLVVDGGAKPDISILSSEARVPWAGHMTRWALHDIYDLIKTHGTSLVFVNTRSQAELLFHELWRINEDTLAIALHHGSLEREQRRKVEAAMADNRLRAVVCTSTLDLGIDWGDVDLVIHVGAPKGASRLAQRIGRANHRMDEPSKAVLVPSNRFEVMECQAALDASYLGHQDTPPIRDGGLDVLAQHILGTAVADAFDPLALHDEIATAYPYRTLDWETFERVVDFVATGGYALRAYERYAKIRRRKDGRWRVSHPKIAQQYRLNVGTIVEVPVLNVRLVGKRGKTLTRGGRVLGTVEEYFLNTLAPGDTFLFAGDVLRLEGVRDDDALVTRAKSKEPKIPYYGGSKFPLTTYLAGVVRGMLAEPERRRELPDQVREWVELQGARSILPRRDQLLVETFPRGRRHYLVAYPFEGRLAHQTLGMLLTRRLERMRLKPMGFVASDYALAIWGLSDLSAAFDGTRGRMEDLFSEDLLGDDLDEWLADSVLLKRTFRACAEIAQLVERRHVGTEKKTGRQVTVSTDLVYDVLRSHEPDHILLRATWADAATGLLDIRRLGQMLVRVKGAIVHQPLERISPLAVPIMLEVGREPVQGEGSEALLAEAADELIREAMG